MSQRRVWPPSGALTNASDYMARLDDNYEWIQLCAHSSPWSHVFKIGGDQWEEGFVSFTDIQSIDPVALFYNLYACSNCRYVETDYMGGWYIFANTYGLAAVGSTKTGSMMLESLDKFYTPVGQYKSLGESFKQWFIAVGPYDAQDRWWHYGMTLLGDPTLSIKVEPFRLTIGGSAGGSVTVSPNGPWYNPSVPGSQELYAPSTVVNLTATPLSGWAFLNWTGDVANPNSANTTVTMNSNKTVTANFVAAFRLTIGGSAGGSVTVSPNGPWYNPLSRGHRNFMPLAQL